MVSKDVNLGRKFGKPDIERTGLFVEMDFMNGNKYIPLSKVMTIYVKGKNLMCPGNKIRDGTRAGYFDTYQRIFIGEGKHRIGKFKLIKDTFKPFVPGGVPKKHATPGDWYGTFEGHIDAFSPVKKKQPPYQRPLKNFITSPSKKGNAGYIDICFDKYPPHGDERYGTKLKLKSYGGNISKALVSGFHPKPYFDKNPFADPPNIKPGPVYVRPPDSKVVVIPPGKIVATGPAKWQGGSHAGCFDKFPAHMPEKYNPPKQKSKKGETENQIFYVQSMGEKSYYTKSVITENTNFRVNCKNYKTYEPSYTKHLL